MQSSVQELLTKMGLPVHILAGSNSADQELILRREIVHADKGVRSK